MKTWDDRLAAVREPTDRVLDELYADLLTAAAGADLFATSRLDRVVGSRPPQHRRLRV